jgi:two-component sensor histidine kinase
MFQKSCIIFLLFLSTLSKAQLGEGLVSAYYFSGDATDTVSKLHGKVNGATLSKDRFGTPNSAYLFDGQNDYINLGTDSRLKKNEMSISLWVKINNKAMQRKNFSYQPFIFTKLFNDTVEYEAYSMGYSLYQYKFFGVNTSVNQNQIAPLTYDSINVNKWYHLVFQFNIDSNYLYLNGVLQQALKKGVNQVYLMTDSIMLGYAGNPPPNEKYGWLNGCLDDIKIYDRLLNIDEIKALTNEANPKFGLPILVEMKQSTKWKKSKEIREYTLWFILVFGIGFTVSRLLSRYLSRRAKEKSDIQQKFAQLEMKALRSQMNPHFIFNAINSIQLYVLTNEKELASKYLVKFSKLIRGVLDLSKRELINLKDELEIVRLYIEIESLRFQNDFNFKINVEEALDKNAIMLPPLIIQPYVENAIWHGLLLKEGEKKLTIHISYQQNNLMIKVEDNGIGRKAASQFKQTDLHHRSFGMAITKERLAILEKMYSITANVEVIDCKDEMGIATGTIVSINLKNKTT